MAARLAFMGKARHRNQELGVLDGRNNVTIVMWDENDFSNSPNLVGLIVDTSYGVHGVKSAKPYNHHSLLKTLEAGFGLGCLNHACDSNAINQSA
jgi:hypothetical protein